MDPLSSIDPTVGGLDTSPPGQIAPMQNRQHRSLGALLAAAGLGALVVVLLATPDSQLFVLVAWVFVHAGEYKHPRDQDEELGVGRGEKDDDQGAQARGGEKGAQRSVLPVLHWCNLPRRRCVQSTYCWINGREWIHLRRGPGPAHGSGYVGRSGGDDRPRPGLP